MLATLWMSLIMFQTHFMEVLTEKIQRALNRVTKCHTMMVQDSFLGSLLVLPMELRKRIVG